MSVIPTQSTLTNELKLHDYKGTKFSMTFGDADINDGYSFARMNFSADDTKLNMYIDKFNLNFICDELTMNDKKIWNEFNQGPNSGMNADMVDGLHGFDIKDRAGHNHYLHMFESTGSKRFVKIATFTPRKVGNAQDFNNNGTMPYQGILANLVTQDKIEEFKTNTVKDLRNAGNAIFQSTDIHTEGIYNSCFRGSVSMLKKNYATTVDIHVGLFGDPTSTVTDGWNSLHKYFYVSLHDKYIPFINENYLENTNTDPNKPKTLATVVLEDSLNVLSKAIETVNNDGLLENDKARASVTGPTVSNLHSRPAMDKSNYREPTDPTKDYVLPAPFPARSHEGDSYGQYLDIFRLYHVDSHVDTIDGVEVITHKFDLYMAVDEKSELHITPYMSSSCLIYNFEEPVLENQLPRTNFLRPKSIYDDRYSHKNHRHYDYEEKIWHLINEVDQVWDAFDNYVVLKQGTANANKIMATDANGNVFALTDNFERHQEARRSGGKVLVTSLQKCIEESSITINELAQLEGVEANIQEQIDELKDFIKGVGEAIPDVSGFVTRSGDTMEGYLSLHAEPTNNMHAVNKKYVDDLIKGTKDLFGNYVKKAGDDMTGDLNMTNGSKVKFIGNGKNAYFYGATTNVDIGCYDPKRDRNIWSYVSSDNCIRLGSNAVILSSGKITMASSAPSSPAVGDIWIKNT